MLDIQMSGISVVEEECTQTVVVVRIVCARVSLCALRSSAGLRSPSLKPPGREQNAASALPAGDR
jgi:hypothetical protein